jgi:hypothetical protein
LSVPILSVIGLIPGDGSLTRYVSGSLSCCKFSDSRFFGLGRPGELSVDQKNALGPFRSERRIRNDTVIVFGIPIARKDPEMPRSSSALVWYRIGCVLRLVRVEIADSGVRTIPPRTISYVCCHKGALFENSGGKKLSSSLMENLNIILL